MERKDRRNTAPAGERTERTSSEREQQQKRSRKMSEYGTQLAEKQKVKRMYGMMERQFRRFFTLATKQVGGAGENLLSLLERRLDNVVFRLKFSTTRAQSRQMVVHGHVLVNGKRVYSPSYFVREGDVVSLSPRTEQKTAFIEQVVDKRLNVASKVPDWLELNKQDRKGTILRLPVRADIQTPIEESLIVELYSK